MTSFCVSFPSIKLLFRQLLVKILDPVAYVSQYEE